MFAMKALSSVDVQEEYRNITNLCRRITNLQEQVLSVGPVSDHLKCLLNGVLEQAKQELTSTTSHILLLRREADELTKRSLAAHPKLEAFSLECETLKKQITELEQTNNFLIASQSQLKNDLMSVYQSKNQRIAELEEKLAKSSESNLASKVVGYERELRTKLEATESEERNSKGEKILSSSPETKSDLPNQDPVTATLQTSSWTSESVEIAAKRTRDPEPIPARDFFVVSKVEQIELINTLVITNIPNCDYGRVVGREGRNVERLRKNYGVKISCVDSHKDLKLFILGANAENRRAAADDIIKNLPLVVECPNLRLQISDREIKQINRDHHVQIILPNFANNNHFTIRGTMDNCQMAYQLLSNHAKL